MTSSNAPPTIPPGLAECADKILATSRTAVRIKLQIAKDLPLWQSKVGGTPYMPLDSEYPKSPEGKPLKLLAQINFTEIPKLPDLPESGLLQFFIDPYDEFLGLGGEFDSTGQKRYRVRYFENVECSTSKLNTEDPFKMEGGISSDGSREQPERHWPLFGLGQYSMEFETFTQVMTSDDYRAGPNIFDCNPNLPWHEQYALKPELFDQYEEHFKGSGHQIGGYPYFTQEDPRGAKPELRGFDLLFQLDSQTFGPNDSIMWGDMGVANFFIRLEDLKKRDFSHVMYYWDCS